MKKSLLLSSIMALVLVIALSTATFAWYGSSTTATANMATLTAASGDGNLQIKGTGDDTYGSRVDITQDGVYVPASLKANLAGATEEANPVNTIDEFDAATSWVVGTANADNTNNLRVATTSDNYVMKYTVTIKNAGAETINVDLAALSFLSNAATSDTNTIKTASSNLASDCAWMIFMTRKMKDGAVNLTEGTDTVTIFNNSEYNTTTLGDDNSKLTTAAQDTVTAVNTLRITGMLPDEEITFTVYNWIDGWKATSDVTNNSQQGKVKFALNFSIAA